MMEPLISEFAHDPEMAGLVEEFLSGLAATCDSLRRSLASSDLPSIRRIGHQMKGAGGGYGFPALTAAGAALEEAVDSDGAVSLNVREQADRFLALCARASLPLAGRPPLAVAAETDRL